MSNWYPKVLHSAELAPKGAIFATKIRHICAKSYHISIKAPKGAFWRPKVLHWRPKVLHPPGPPSHYYTWWITWFVTKAVNPFHRMNSLNYQLLFVIRFGFTVRRLRSVVQFGFCVLWYQDLTYVPHVPYLVASCNNYTQSSNLLII